MTLKEMMKWMYAALFNRQPEEQQAEVGPEPPRRDSRQPEELDQEVGPEPPRRNDP